MSEQGTNGGNGSEAQGQGMALELYGSRAEVKELSTRILWMLPSVKACGRSAAHALAQVALCMELNPFVGEIWAIPQQGGKTFTIMPGIKGIRRKAHEKVEAENGFYTTDFRRPTDDEIEGYELMPGDIARACDVRVITDTTIKFKEALGKFPMYTGLGVYKKGEPTKMHPLQVARKRAEADALKQAFDLPLPVVMEPGADPDDHGWDVVGQETSMAQAQLERGEAGDIVEDNVVGEPAPVQGSAAEAERELFDW